MNTRSLILVSVLSALIAVGAGCSKPAPEPLAATPAGASGVTAPPSPPGVSPSGQ